MFWSKKPAPPVHDRSRLVGVDLTASRIRAVSVGPGKPRPLFLDGPDHELPLVLDLDRRTPEVGRAGAMLVRRLPHAVCQGFLAAVGTSRTWSVGRNTVTADAAQALAFARLHGPITHESEAAALALPAYLTAAQAKKVVAAAAKAKLPLVGTAAAPLAVVAHRADVLLAPADPAAAEPDPDGGRPDWVVPIRRPDPGPGAVVVLDADDHALSAAVVAVDPDAARLVGSAAWPRAAARVWGERLLDSLSDRCVRLCRRDPRDSAEAEQALWDQLADAMTHTAAGRPVCLTVRSAHWYQDLPLRPEEVAGYCAPLAAAAVDGLRELLAAADLPAPPRAVWLTPAAGRLPGLAEAVYHGSAEQTQVAVLPADAVAEAAAALAARWRAGELPRAHLDTTLPLKKSDGGRVADGPAPVGPPAVVAQSGGLAPRRR